ncbi:MAG TPA: NADH-quinone oxidoreductase subunit H [Fibrobacteria bacterium]|nr:NADH-quinone oxidoreductase subunit H [Fibrobacteria bacterium]
MTFSVGPVSDSIASWIAGLGVPALAAQIVAVLFVCAAPVLGIVFPIAGVAQYFERKVAGLAQRRKGPMVGATGLVDFVFDLALFFQPKWRRRQTARRFERLPVVSTVLGKVRMWGLGSIAADGVKMFLKEDMAPAGADKLLFHGSTYLAMTGAFLAFAVFPFSQWFHMGDPPVAALYLGAVTGLVAVSVLKAGWSSNNKWSYFGGIRSVAMIVSYETPIALSIAVVCMWSGTMSLQGIIAAQYHPGWFSIAGWNLFQSPFLALVACVYYVAALAECNRAPFDLSEGESELVGGFHTEYSGLRWGLFFIAEYSDMILVGGLFATMFLGGYQSPVGEEWIVSLPPVAEALVHTAILVAKAVLSVGFMMWVRWTLPRFRIDQVMRLSWTKLVPLALVSLFGLAVTQILTATRTGVVEIAYGRYSSAPVVRPDLFSWMVSWAVVGGAMVALVAMAKHWGAPPEPIEMRRLTGKGAP